MFFHHSQRQRPWFVALGLLPLLLWPSVSRAIELFAAASLRDVVSVVMVQYAESVPKAPRVRLVLAASSTLARQLEAGAPGDLYLSAHPYWVDYLAARQYLEPGYRRTLLGNRLVLLRAGPTLDAESAFAALRQDPNLRLALGDPAHVPAGLYAREALEHLGLWQVLSANRVYSENVRAALALVERTEADFGIVYVTDAALAPQLSRVHVFDEAIHTPIRYTLAVLRQRDHPEVVALWRFLQSTEAAKTFRQFGFSVLPDDVD